MKKFIFSVLCLSLIALIENLPEIRRLIADAAISAHKPGNEPSVGRLPEPEAPPHAIPEPGWSGRSESHIPMIKENSVTANDVIANYIRPHDAETKVNAAQLRRFLRITSDLGRRVWPTNATYAVFPTNETAFSKIFQRDATLKELKQVKREAPLLKAIQEIHFAQPGEGLAGFEAFLKESESSFVSLVGHNESGQFRFLDGTKVSLAAIARRCLELSKRCILLSCRSHSFVPAEMSDSMGIRSDITFGDAALISTAINKHFAKLRGEVEQISYEDLMAEMPKLLTAYVVGAKVTGIVEYAVWPIITGYAVGLVVLYVEISPGTYSE